MKLEELADLVGGEVVGDPRLEITGASGLEQAGAQEISYLAEERYRPLLESSRAGAVVVAQKLDTDKAQILHPQPALAFARIVNQLHPEPRPPAGVHPSAVLESGVSLGKNVSVGPLAVLGEGVVVGDNTVIHAGVVIGEGCRLGRDTVLFPQVVLYRDTRVGDHVRIHAGAVIGSDGFSYNPDAEGRQVKMPQIGRVVIEDHVEIGANACIDRAAFGETRIEEGVKIDNLVQIAHNCRIGAHSIIVSQTGLSGSCTIGRQNVLAGQVGLADHVTLGDKVTLLARTGVFRDLPKPGLYGWAPAMPSNELMHFMPVLLRLPELAGQVKELERRLRAIEKA